eukprot:703231_1
MSKGWVHTFANKDIAWDHCYPGKANIASIKPEPVRNSKSAWCATQRYVPMSDMRAPQDQQRCLMVFKPVNERNPDRWLMMRPLPQLFPQIDYKNTNYQDCKHDITCILKPMYLLELARNSINIPSLISAHQEAVKYITHSLKNNTVCKNCAMTLLLKTQCLKKLMATTGCILTSIGDVPYSLMLMHLFYSAIVMTFMFHHPNIMRFVMKELTPSLQMSIMQFTVYIHGFLDQFIDPQMFADAHFLYTWNEWFMVRNCLANVLLKSYKYWHKKHFFVERFGTYVIDKCSHCLNWLLSAPKPQDFEAIYSCVLHDVCLLAQCMNFERKMIASVYELWSKYYEKNQSKYVNGVSEMVQLLLLTCNHTDAGTRHRNDVRKYIMNVSRKHNKTFIRCQRNHCKNRSKKRLKLCSKCRSVYYCSRKCQKIAWKHSHRNQCSKIETFKHLETQVVYT